VRGGFIAFDQHVLTFQRLFAWRCMFFSITRIKRSFALMGFRSSLKKAVGLKPKTKNTAPPIESPSSTLLQPPPSSKSQELIEVGSEIRVSSIIDFDSRPPSDTSAITLIVETDTEVDEVKDEIKPKGNVLNIQVKRNPSTQTSNPSHKKSCCSPPPPSSHTRK
jgi:hypothetical protein